MAKNKDPEAPYYKKPTPGKPGWNISKNINPWGKSKDSKAT